MWFDLIWFVCSLICWESYIFNAFRQDIKFSVCLLSLRLAIVLYKVISIILVIKITILLMKSFAFRISRISSFIVSF